MRIDKLHLQDFGQFHDRDVTLAPGINVVYGANEAGKSTMKDFIIDMLYGIEKLHGMGGRLDHYDQRKPIYGSDYSGAMEVSVDGYDYRIERNFDYQNKRTVVKDMDTGKELALSEAEDLMGTVIHTDKSTYLNTLCIGQLGAGTDREITDRLNQYIVNMASSKAGDIDAVSAIMELKAKKEAFSNAKVEAREQEITSKLQLERDFDAEIAAVRDEYAKLEAQKNKPKEEQLQFTPIRPNQAEQEAGAQKEPQKRGRTKQDWDMEMLRNMGKKSMLDNVMVIFLLGLLTIALFIGIAYVVPVNNPSIKIAIIGAGVFYALITVIQILVKRSKLYKLMEDIEIEQNFEEAKIETVDANEQRELLNRLSELKNKEEDIIAERKEQEQLLEELEQLKEQKVTNRTETEALDLAIKTIQDLSEEIYDSFGSVLNEQVSAIIQRITGNRYSEVRIDDQLRVMVRSGNSFISMEYLSTGTMEQIYLALRLAIANVLITEELPIIMDDVFVTYDEQRIYETLSCLGEYRRHQMILFTKNPELQNMITRLGIESNYIAI